MIYKITSFQIFKNSKRKRAASFSKQCYFVIFFLTQTIISQESYINYEKLWEGDYDPQRLELILPMKDDNHYTVLEQNKKLNSSSIISYSYADSMEQLVIFDSAKFSEKLEISSYSFSKDEQNLLLETLVDPIYRRSKQGIYWIYNIKSKKLQKLREEKIQEPIFSPDGNYVAYVYRRNIFVKNLINQITIQLTFDGDYQTINGLTDWVYEEEFGFVRAFDWSPDSKKIVYMRFDESKVPYFFNGDIRKRYLSFSIYV